MIGLTLVKKPSPSIARSSAAPVCWIGPSEKFWSIDWTVEPIPLTSLGLVEAALETMSEKLMRLFLKPAVSALARLLAMTDSSVCAFLRPLSEV